MGNWLERLDRAKREKEERDRQRKVTELGTELGKESLAREKRQQEIFLVEQKRVKLRTDLARFEPETLLLGIKQKVWGQGSLEEWEYIYPSDPREHRAYKEAKYVERCPDPKYREHSLWYVATGLVYEYADVKERIYGGPWGPSHGPPYGSYDGSYERSYKGKSRLALVIGVGIFYPKNERMVFLYNQVPYDIIWGGIVGKVSDSSTPRKLQDALLKQAFAVTPSEAEKASRERLRGIGM